MAIQADARKAIERLIVRPVALIVARDTTGGTGRTTDEPVTASSSEPAGRSAISGAYPYVLLVGIGCAIMAVLALPSRRMTSSSVGRTLVRRRSVLLIAAMQLLAAAFVAYLVLVLDRANIG